MTNKQESKMKQEVNRIFNDNDFSSVKNVIFPESFFFANNKKSTTEDLEDHSEIFKDLHHLANFVQELVSRKIAIHIQVSKNNYDNLDRNSIINIISDLVTVSKIDISRHLMFYCDYSVKSIAVRIMKNEKPGFTISSLGDGIKQLGNALSFTIKSRKKSTYDTINLESLVIIVNSDFSSIEREGLFLSNYRVMDYSYQAPKVAKRKKVKKEVKLGSKKSNIDKSAAKKTFKKPDQVELKEVQKKYDQALDIYSKLCQRASEFSKLAVEFERKSSDKISILKEIESSRAQDASSHDIRDLDDAKMQCKKEIDIYSSQARDYLDLYMQFKQQAKDAKDDLSVAEIDIKKIYS